MKIVQKICILIMLMLSIFDITGNVHNHIFASSNLNSATRQIVNIGVLLSDFNSQYISLIRKNLDDIQKENESKVKFTFFDSKANQSLENETIDHLVNDNIDLLIVNLVNTKSTIIEDLINNVKRKKIPLIVFNNLQPSAIDAVKSYPKAVVVSTEIEQPGILEGQILVNLWNSNKDAIDKNNDNKLQYILLKGEPNSESAIQRTNYALSTINNAGIQTDELRTVVSYWDEGLAQTSIDSLFLRYNGAIEAIISNNDAMAIGAIKALQKYGYNTGDPAKTIPVVGIGGIPAAVDLIDKGFMTGTVDLDARTQAEVIYNVGLNLINNQNPITNTNYKLDNTGVVIRIPSKELIKN